MYFQIAAVILLSLGLFWKGCLITEADWRKQVDALNVKLKVAEGKSKEVNVVIKDRIVTKIKTVKVVAYCISGSHVRLRISGSFASSGV